MFGCGASGRGAGLIRADSRTASPATTATTTATSSDTLLDPNNHSFTSSSSGSSESHNNHEDVVLFLPSDSTGHDRNESKWLRNRHSITLTLTPSPAVWSGGCALRGQKPTFPSSFSCPWWVPDPSLFQEHINSANQVVALLYCKRRFLCLGAFELAFLAFVLSIFIIFLWFPAIFRQDAVYIWYLAWWLAYTVWGLALLLYRNWKMAQIQKKLMYYQTLWSTPEMEYSFSNFGICCNFRGIILTVTRTSPLPAKTMDNRLLPQPAMKP